MLALAVALYMFVLLTCIAVPFFRRKYTCISVVVFFWSVCTFVWYVYSPIYDGPPRILKSVERSLVDGSVVHNWGNTDKCEPQHIVHAHSAADVRGALAHGRVRVAGAGHSWTPLICSKDTVLFMDWCHVPHMNGTHVTADAGCTIAQVQRALQPSRMLHGFGGIQYQTLAGGVMTSLHGAQFDSFASHVTHMQVMLANGTVADIVGDELRYWRHSMGMLGIVLKITLRTHPVQSVLVRKRIVSLEDSMLAMHNDSLTGLVIDAVWGTHNTHVGLLTYSEPKNESLPYHDAHSNLFSFFFDNVVMPAQMLVPEWIASIDITRGMIAKSTERKSMLDAWDTHMGFGYLSAEYSVPIHNCHETILRVRDVADGRLISLYVRKLNRDPDYLAFATVDACIVETAYLALDADFEKDMMAYHKNVESIVESYGGRTHWGKFYASDFTKLTLPPAFDTYRRRVDPGNKFMNDYTERIMNQKTPKYNTFTITTRGHLWRTLWWTTVAVGFAAAVVPVSYMPSRPFHGALWVCILVSATIAKGLHQGLPEHDHRDHQAGVIFGQYGCIILACIHVTDKWRWLVAVSSAVVGCILILFNCLARHTFEHEQYWSVVTAVLLFVSAAMYTPRNPTGYSKLNPHNTLTF